jgi:hypothetical protein
VEKYSRARQATDDNMAHAHCMMDTYGYKHTHTICNTYGFSTATMVARTRLIVTLYVHCLYCYRCRPSLSNSPKVLRYIFFSPRTPFLSDNATHTVHNVYVTNTVRLFLSSTMFLSYRQYLRNYRKQLKPLHFCIPTFKF